MFIHQENFGELREKNCRDYCVCVLHIFVYLDLFDRPGERSLRRSDWRFNVLGAGHLQSQLTVGNSNECNNALLCVVCSWKKPFSIFLCVTYSKRFLVTFITRVLNVKYIASVLDLILKYWEKWFTLFIFLFFRVVETLRNSVDFAKAFNCKLGSPMNPEQKCEVWWQLLNQFRNIFFRIWMCRNKGSTWNVKKKRQKTKKNETKEQPEKTRFGFSLCSEHFNQSNQKQKHV